MDNRGFRLRLDLLDRRQELGQTFEREKLALQRNEHAIARRQGIDRQQIERRRTIHQDIGDPIAVRQRAPAGQSVQRVAQPKIALLLIGNRQFHAQQIKGGRRNVQPWHGSGPDRGIKRALSPIITSKVEMVRCLRSMPKPVEALPCGSRSMIRTVSPIAAKAVPRLIAVVVLPTPPFWLAKTRTRICS